MTGLTAQYSARVCGTIYSILVDLRIVSHTRNRVTSKYHAHILPLSALKYFISVVDHSKTHAFIVIKGVYFSQENLKAKEIMGI